MSGLSSTSVDDALAATAATGSPGRGDPTSGVGGVRMDLERGALVGRYVVLAKLGAGGMGVVFAAYDPELDRKVALKLLHPRLVADAELATTREARARLIREAQALARLNHPHIVAIHDVGEHQGAVWLAMEYVDGETFAAWAKQRPRTWREVVAVLICAARGLCAAHEAGLVHRDIKPDNIMVGHDGRVRVMDLGLARALARDDEPAQEVSIAARTAAAGDLAVLAARVTRVGAVMGTPAYMSPEQFRGVPVDARADVFALCVTLWEALHGERPFAGDTLVELAAHVLSGTVRAPSGPQARRVPGWLRRVCLRGLAAAPERRFASMQALLGALTRGRTRARVYTWLAGAAVAVTVAASVALYHHHDRAGRVAACEDAGARIVEVWNDEARASVRAGILATGLGYAPVTADKVMPFLDAQAAAWRDQRTRACVRADLEATLDAEQLDRVVWCLDERWMELAALVTELSRADADVVQKSVLAAAELAPVSACTDDHVLAALPAPPSAELRPQADAVRTRLSRARTLLAAGKYADGLPLARTALADAEAHAWLPLTAAARQLEGELLMKSGRHAEGEAASLAAYMQAARLRAWHVAAPAARDLLANIGYAQARHAEGKVWAGHAEVAISFAGDPVGLREADRLHQLANVHFATGEYAVARQLHERSLALREQALGPDHPVVATSLNNLAIVLQELRAFAEAKLLLERALQIQEQALGPEHPGVAGSLNNLAILYQRTGAYTEAMPLQQRALEILEKALGPEHPGVAVCLNNLATLHKRAGAYAAARTLQTRALAIQEKALGPEHPDVAASLSNLADLLWKEGAVADAKAHHERALAIRERTLGPEHPSVAASLALLGALALKQAEDAEALPLLERAVAIHDAQAHTSDAALQARFNLARALIATRGDRSRALAEAQTAAAGFRAAGPSSAEDLAEVEAFIAAAPP